MSFKKITAVCPHCGRQNTFESMCVDKGCLMTNLTCSFCKGNWKEALAATNDFAKSASSPSLSAEIAQARSEMAARFEELTNLVAKVGKIIEERNRAASTFQPIGNDAPATVAKAVIGAPGGIIFVPQESHAETQVQKNHVAPADAEARANYELQKALANGTPVTVPSGGTGQSFKPIGAGGGVEKLDQAHEELQKALRQGRPAFVPRG